MLQIISGKFFARAEEVKETDHSGVLYSNARMHAPLETCIGTLYPAVQAPGIQGLVYRVTERLELYRPDGSRSIIASTGGREIVADFAAFAAFSLNLIVTPDSEAARHLIGGSTRGGVVGRPLSDVVERVFDTRVEVTQDDREHMSILAERLVGLRRKSYLAAMRAIRRYVLAIERIADEPDLAYVLLVAALESLVQGFDQFGAAWGDVEQAKRERIDKALAGASAGVAEAVRGAVLASEHAALSRRFREFVNARVARSYFREEARGVVRPVQRAELGLALDAAYRFRSKYVHTLRELPSEFTVLPAWDTAEHDGKPAFTFRGLARLARHVIHQFIQAEPQVAREELDYWQELPGVLRMRLANRYWIWRADTYTPASARRYLSGFLEDLTAVLKGADGAGITAIPDVIGKIERTVRGLARPDQRLPMVTLHFLYHHYTGFGEEAQAARIERFLEAHVALFDEPSPESMVAHVLLEQPHDWTAAGFEGAWMTYASQRWRRGALVLPRLLESACLLELAEAYRREGNQAVVEIVIAKAVEAMPGNERLIEWEAETLAGIWRPIQWRAILIGPPANDAVPQQAPLADPPREV